MLGLVGFGLSGRLRLGCSGLSSDSIRLLLAGLINTGFSEVSVSELVYARLKLFTCSG